VPPRPAHWPDLLRGVGEVLVELVVADRALASAGRRGFRALALAGGALGLLVGGVGRLTACSSLVSDAGTCGPASLRSALATNAK
jgi:hypothetical protein